MPEGYNNRTQAGLQWDYLASVSGAHPWADEVSGGAFTARRITCNGAGDLYLLPVGVTSGTGTLFMAGVTAGQVFDQHCDGIGSSTTCTKILGQR